jgi:hypothetical protein
LLLLEHIKQRNKQLPLYTVSGKKELSPSAVNGESANDIAVRGKSAEMHHKARESIHLQKLEIDSNVSKDAIRLYSGHSRIRMVAQAREVVLSHRHD